MLLANLQEAGVDIHDLVIEPLMVPQSCQVLAPHVDAAACVLCTDFVTRPDCPSAAHLQVKPAYGMHGGLLSMLLWYHSNALADAAVTTYVRAKKSASNQRPGHLALTTRAAMQGSHAKSLWIHPNDAIKPVQWVFPGYLVTTELHLCKYKAAHARARPRCTGNLWKNCSLPQLTMSATG